MSALHDLTVAQLAAKLKAREVSAVEAAQHFLARSRQHADLGAYLAPIFFKPNSAPALV